MATHQQSFDPDTDNAHVEFFKDGGGIGSRTVAVRADALDENPFDESLDLREDPHLWTRLLAEHNAAHIPEPLAIKRKRDGSITDDPAEVFANELQEIESLCETFPELREHREERIREAKFRLARGYLQQNRSLAPLWTLLLLLVEEWDWRVAACLPVALLPVGNARALQALQRVREVVK